MQGINPHTSAHKPLSLLDQLKDLKVILLILSLCGAVFGFYLNHIVKDELDIHENEKHSTPYTPSLQVDAYFRELEKSDAKTLAKVIVYLRELEKSDAKTLSEIAAIRTEIKYLSQQIRKSYRRTRGNWEATPDYSNDQNEDEGV